MLRAFVLFIIFCSSEFALGISSSITCTGLFSGVKLPYDVGPVVETAYDIEKQNLSDEELEEKYVRETIYDFEEFSAVLNRVGHYEKTPNEVRVGPWDRMLQRIEPGDWEKVFLVLRDRREIHFYRHRYVDVVAFPKWKAR